MLCFAKALLASFAIAKPAIKHCIQVSRQIIYIKNKIKKFLYINQWLSVITLILKLINLNFHSLTNLKSY